MTGKENLLKVLRGGESERVPWVPFVGVHSAKLLGVSLEDFFYDSDLIAKGVVNSAKLYKADAIPLAFDLQLEAEILGAKTKILPKMPPAIIKHPLADKIKFPSYNPNSGRLAIALNAVPSIKKGLGENTALLGLVCGVLTLSYQLRGRALLDDIKAKNTELKELLSYAKEVQLKTIQAYVQSGVDAITVVEPMCSNLDTKFFIEELFALENELFDSIKRAGLPSSFFSCGDVNALLPKICKMHCDNISVCSNVDLEILKREAINANKSFGGNLNPRQEILKGTKEDCIKAVKNCLELGGKKGYILSSGCDLAYETPSENLIAIGEYLA